MEVLKKRSTAAFVLAAVIVVFTVLGINLSAGRVAEKTEKMFYEGVYLKDEGYTEKSIQSQLENRIKAAMGLITLTSDDAALSDETAALRDAREALYNAESIGEKFEANERLEVAYKALSDAMPAEIAESDAAKSYLSTMSGAQSVIERSAYNAEAEKAAKSVLGGVLMPLRLLVFGGSIEYFA